MKLPDYYEFQSAAKIMSGKFALENIPQEMRNLHAVHPMILSDNMLEKIGTLQKVLDALASQGMEAGAIYTDIPADSSLHVVNGIAKEFKRKNCDSLIAVGGGSVIDTAKGVRMLLSQDMDDILEVWGCENLTMGHRVPFIAVPTTSGTGSESTLVAVIKNEARKLKMEFISYYLQPDVAVLDVRMTETLPPRMTELIRDNLERAVNRGHDGQARLAMANASMMAGAAFSNSMVGIVHAIGHALGGVCHVPHGDAMTILLPHGMAYNYADERTRQLYGELLLPLAGEEVYFSTPKAQRAKQAIKEVWSLRKRLHRSCGLSVRLRDFDVNPEDFEKVAETAINDGAMLVNPRKADVEDVLFILKKAF